MSGAQDDVAASIRDDEIETDARRIAMRLQKLSPELRNYMRNVILNLLEVMQCLNRLEERATRVWPAGAPVAPVKAGDVFHVEEKE